MTTEGITYKKNGLRPVYVTLAEEINHTVCSFCKFNFSDSAGESPCDAGEPSCYHPLADSFRFNDNYGIEPGCDCWGFRPSYDVSFVADIVGIVLSKKWPGFSLWQNKHGTWRIAEWTP